MKGYHVNIFYSEPDEGYIADIPDLKVTRIPSDHLSRCMKKPNKRCAKR